MAHSHSYVDGIKVKISERYKPPFRISKPQHQHLILNGKLRDEMPCSKFILEREFTEKMKDIREARKNMLQERKQRLIEKQEEFKRKIEKEESDRLNKERAEAAIEKEAPDANNVLVSKSMNACKESTVSESLSRIYPTQTNSSQNQRNYITKNGILMPIPASSTCSPYADNILNPQSGTKCYEPSPLNVKTFNLSDFESDTSSPFDNMELKSINDLEELAQVLKSDRSNNFPSGYSGHTANYQSTAQFSDAESYGSGSKFLQAGGYKQVSKNVSQNASLLKPNTGLIQSSISCNKVSNSYSEVNSNFNQIPTSFNQYATPYMPTPSFPLSSYTNSPNGYLYNIPQTTSQLQTSYSNDPSNCQHFTQLSELPMRKSQCKSVPDLAHSVQQELQNTHIEDPMKNDGYLESTSFYTKTNAPIPIRPKSTDSGLPKGKVKDGTLSLLESLTRHEREICQNVSLMGFPLDRVVRICRVVGGDQKKVVDHLLALSELLDLGFSEMPASEALLINDNDRDKALDQLIL